MGRDMPSTPNEGCSMTWGRKRGRTEGERGEKKGGRDLSLEPESLGQIQLGDPRLVQLIGYPSRVREDDFPITPYLSPCTALKKCG